MRPREFFKPSMAAIPAPYLESIYNLLPKDVYVPPKEARHISKYPGSIQPSYSTFGIAATSQPAVRIYRNVKLLSSSTAAAMAALHDPQGLQKAPRDLRPPERLGAPQPEEVPQEGLPQVPLAERPLLHQEVLQGP